MPAIPDHNPVAPVLAHAKKWLAYIGLVEHEARYDARHHNLLIATMDNRGLLAEALMRCGYGPGLAAMPLALPVGTEGIVHDALLTLLRLCNPNGEAPSLKNNLEWAIRAIELHLAEGQQTEARSIPNQKDAGGQAENPQSSLTAEERCIMIYMRDPNKSLRKIAAEAGCDPAIPFRSKKLHRLRKSDVGKLPRGYKTKQGAIEAEADEG
jgi:hypothetical protein